MRDRCGKRLRWSLTLYLCLSALHSLMPSMMLAWFSSSEMTAPEKKQHRIRNMSSVPQK